MEIKQNTPLYHGHRARMRAKLRDGGDRYLENYELLEMLLYHAIPRADTHPTAKRLLLNFTSLEKLFSASEEELTKTAGVGAGAARLIRDTARFIHYKGFRGALIKDSDREVFLNEKEFLKDVLARLISHSSKEPKLTAEALTEAFETKTYLAEANIDTLEKYSDERSAELIFIATRLEGRLKREPFRTGRRYTEDEIKEYLTALYTGVGEETVSVLSFDKAMKLLWADKIGIGTVNSAGIVPRLIIDTANKRGAASVIIAHNHPGALAETSREDIDSTLYLLEILNANGLNLICHYIVGGGECVKLRLDSNRKEEYGIFTRKRI